MFAKGSPESESRDRDIRGRDRGEAGDAESVGHPALGPKGRFAAWALGLALIVALVGCRPAPEQRKLTVYCGAGMREPVAEIAAAFETQEGLTVECSYEGSELLLSKITLARQGDIYLPGDVHYVDQADEAGLIADRANVCYFIPTILVAKGNPKEIASVEDFLRDDLVIGLGDPEACAIGRKMKKLFEKNGVDPAAVEERVDFQSMTVNELATNVKLGSLDAAIVWDAVARTVADATETVAIPVDRNVISTVVAGTLTTSESPDAARRFLDFLVSETGRAVFEKYHYSLDLPE